MPNSINQLMTDSGFEPVVPKGPSVPSTFNPADHAPGEKPKSAKEVAEKSMMGWLNSDMQYFNANDQIKPYTYDAGMNSSSFYERYKAYGNETFDRIGFSPFKDNDAEFNAGTGAMAEFQRTWTHSFKPLFARGFTSGPKSLYRMMQGDFSDDPEEAAAYARAAAIGQSTKGGALGFTNNMLLNFGYSAGIMSEAILEEIAGIGLSAVLGPEIGMLTTANAGRRVAQGLEGLKVLGSVEKTGLKMADYLKDLNNINKTREFFNATKAGVAAEKTFGYSKRLLNFANPLSNTTDAIGAIARNEKQLAGLAKLANASYQTAGALYRDVRNVNMALSEARLEGGFARKETEDELIREYRRTHKGMMPDEKILDGIKKEAGKASADAIFANTLLIYASNKVSFDNIMNPKKGLNGLLTKKIADIKTNMAGRTVKEFTKKTLSTGKEILTPKISWVEKGWKGFKGTAQAIKKQGFQKTALKTIGYTKANLMEGAQESLQDVIAQTAKDYHKQAFYSQPVASYYYTQGQLNDLKDKRSFGQMLGDAAGKQVSGQGLETFASGFAMGALAHPLNQALPFVQKKYQQIFNKDKYLANKKYIADYSANMAASVTKTFENDPLKYYNTKLYGLGTQAELASILEDAGDKEHQDAKNEATVKEITNLIESGTTDIWLDHLESLKGLTTEEYAEAMGITAEEAEGHVEKLDKMINRTKEIEKTYKELNDKLPNPVNLDMYEKGTKDYEKASVYYKAWEEGKKAVIFYGETYKNTVMRMQSVFQDAASNKLIGKVDPNRVQVLFQENRLDSELNILENEIGGLRGLDDDYSKKQLSQKTETLKTLKEFKESYTQFMDHFFRGNQKQDTGEEEFINSEIKSLENQLAKADSKDKKTIQLKLDSLYQRSKTIAGDVEKATKKAAISDKKGRVNEIESKIDELNARKKQIESPEYYETYIKDNQFAKNEIETIDRQIAQLEKDRDAANEELEGDMTFTNDKITNQLEASFKKYMKVLAGQSDDIILDGQIDEAFGKLIDYYRLGEESFKLADAVNMLTDPSGFIDHVERTYDWMYADWTNREEDIKSLINDQIERLKFNQLLNEMAAKGIYVDLNEFADFKEYGVIPSEFFDNTNKRVIKPGSPIYEQVANEFRKISMILDLTESMKSDSEKLNDQIQRLNQEEQSEIKKLPTTPQRVKVRDFDSNQPFSSKVITDQLGINQYAEVTYEDEGVEKTQIFYKGDDNILRYDDKNGEAVDGNLKINFTSGEIFSIIEKANPAEVSEINEKYNQLRAEAAEKAVEETSKPFTENAEPVVTEEITADTPIESMPEDLRQQLIDSYDAYRRDPKNKSLFPDSLSEDDLSDRFKTYIKSEPEALSIIETYVKEQKLKASTAPAGEVVVPTIMLPNGKSISAADASDKVLQETLKRYRLQISELSNKGQDKLTPTEKEDLALLKVKANMLSAYIENERVKEMTPELKDAKAKIDLLLKEQSKITPMLTGYDVEGQVLRRVSNVIAGLKGEKYAYTAIEEVKALYNETLGTGQSVDAFIEKLRAANLPGFSEYTYTELKADIEEAIANQKKVPTTTAPSSVKYADLVAEASLQEFVNPLPESLTYLFFANLINAIKSGRIKSKAELNAIIAEWDEMAAYNGNPNRMTEAQASILAGEAQTLPETSPVELPTAQSTDTLGDIVERSVTEKTYEENRIGGNYVDAQAKTFFEGGKPEYDPNKITKEAFDNLFGENGLFQIIKQWMDTNDMIVVSKGLVVYDKAANVAGEIDLLLANKKGEFFIVDLKTGSKDKWAGYNNPESLNYAKKMENTYQQGAYVNLLRNMLGITATPKIFPIEVELEKGTGRILKASKPTASSALKPGKILIDLNVTPEMQTKLDELIPMTEPSVSLVPPSAKVETLVETGANETVEGSDYEGPAPKVTPVNEPTDKVSQLEREINKADFDKLQMIELNFGLKDSLEMTADEVLKVQEMIDSRRAILSSGETVVMEQKTYSIGDEVYTETTIFTETGKNKGQVFLEPYQVGVISKIDFANGTVTINPVGKKNQKTIPMAMLDKLFKLKSEVSEEPVSSTTPTADDKAKVKESTDVVSTLANNSTRQIELEKEAEELGTVEETLNDLLDDLDC